MDKKHSSLGLRLMLASTALLGFLVIFIFLQSNNVTAHMLPVFPS
jgi:hypothetical protein